MSEDKHFWRTCITCKKEIKFSTKYYKCSVTSCDKKRSPAQFCSVDCWDVHRSIMSHKSAGADEYHSPTKDKWLEEQSSQPKVRIVGQKSTIKESQTAIESDEILVVVSKLKSFVKESTGLNTSADVMAALSDIIREACLKAAQNGHRSGRKTLMARDFQ